MARRAGRTSPRTRRGSRRGSTCGDYFAVRDAALQAHATQVDPDGRWFSIPLPLQQAAWPTEDYQLARSLVDTTLPEDDLFAGVRDLVRTP